jgi:phage gp36-like protein
MTAPYIDLAGLYARFGEEEINQISDTDGTGTPDPALVSRAVSDVTSEIDAALSVRYALPLERPVPDLIHRIAAELAREALYTRKPDAAVTERAKWARKTLLALADGKMSLGLAEAETRPQGGLVEMVSGRERPPFASPVVRRGRR